MLFLGIATTSRVLANFASVPSGLVNEKSTSKSVTLFGALNIPVFVSIEGFLESQFTYTPPTEAFFISTPEVITPLPNTSR